MRKMAVFFSHGSLSFNFVLARKRALKYLNKHVDEYLNRNTIDHPSDTKALT